jgi:hypothetical protein
MVFRNMGAYKRRSIHLFWVAYLLFATYTHDWGRKPDLMPDIDPRWKMSSNDNIHHNHLVSAACTCAVSWAVLLAALISRAAAGEGARIDC